MGLTIQLPEAGLLGVSGANLVTLTSDTLISNSMVDDIFILGGTESFDVTLSVGTLTNPIPVGSRLVFKRNTEQAINFFGIIDGITYSSTSTPPTPYVVGGDEEALFLIYTDATTGWLDLTKVQRAFNADLGDSVSDVGTATTPLFVWTGTQDEYETIANTNPQTFANFNRTLFFTT